MKQKRIKIVAIAKKMPPLLHKMPSQNYNIQKSHVIKWMLRHDEAWEYIWNAIKQSGAIEYNPNTHLWQGVDYKK